MAPRLSFAILQTWIVLCWLWPFLAFGEPADWLAPFSGYNARIWHAEDGLAHEGVVDCLQTPDGYIWAATRGGLSRFDGSHFRTILETRAACVALCQDEGKLWVGSEDGRLFNLKNDQCEELTLPSGRAFGRLGALCRGWDGALWIGAETGGLLRHKEGHFSQWTTREGLAHNAIRALREDAEQRLWIGTAAGLNCLCKGKITTLTAREGLLHESIRALCVDRKGDLWIGSELGVTRLSGGRFTHYTKDDGLSDNVVSAIFEDREGQIWIGTFNGLNRWANGKLSVELLPDGTGFDRVSRIAQDCEGGIWVGMRDGLARLSPRALKTFTKKDGLSHNSVTSVFEDRSGSIWIGTWGGGVNRIKAGQIRAWTEAEGLSSDLVLTIHQSRRSSLWLGMDYEGGINHWRSETNIHHVRELEGLRDPEVKAIQDDHLSNLWIGTRTALVALNNGAWRRFTTADGLPSDTVECLCEDREGRIWVGCTAGLALLEDGKLSTPSASNLVSHPWVSAIYEDQQGILWLGTQGGGLNRLSQGSVRAYTVRDGLFSDQICGVVEDDFGCLWMSSPHGIFRLRKSMIEDFDRGATLRLICASFGKADGMLSVECKGSGKTAACKTRDGRLWFPTAKGVVVVDPRRVPLTSKAPPVVIEEFKAGGKAASLSTSKIALSHSRDLVFTFAPLALSSAVKFPLRFKLEGWDKDWVDAGDRRQACYPHLPAGDYCFRVTSCDSEGRWNPRGASLNFVIQPAIWRTGWFSIFAALALAGASAWGVRRVSLKRIDGKIQRVRQERALDQERARIARDMHDELGARLTEIMLLSSVARSAAESARGGHLERIERASRETIRNLDSMVWAVNPENDTLEESARYLQEYTQLFLEPAAIRCRFDFPDSLPEIRLSSQARHHLFCIVKEALNNVVKHSRCSTLWLRLRLEAGSLVVSLADDGNGFSPGSAAAGNGLKNMKTRAAAAGGEVEMDSHPGRGTKVQIRLSLGNC